MKLIIPNKIKVGPLEYEIVFSDRVLEKMNDRAMVSIKEQIIRLYNGMSDVHKFVNLVHELDHIAEDGAGIQYTEQNTCGRSYLFADALLSMGVEPDFSLIKYERIKIED